MESFPYSHNNVAVTHRDHGALFHPSSSVATPSLAKYVVANDDIPLAGPQHGRSNGNKNNDMKPLEDFVASEFCKLSVEEQTKALSDLYCQSAAADKKQEDTNLSNSSSCDLNENPVMIQDSLRRFELQIQQGNFPIYDIALVQNRSYVQDPTFRLKFLRANRHNVPKAVHQMTCFLQEKAVHFGQDKVAREITLDDLSPEELDLMISDRYHIQGGRDQKGRVIHYSFPAALGGGGVGVRGTSSCPSVGMVNRVNYYVWFNILSNMAVVQSKGLVAVHYDTAQPDAASSNKPSFDFIHKSMAFFATMPIRYSAIHLCFPESAAAKRDASIKNLVLGAYLRSIPLYSRARTTMHHGSDWEIQYRLIQQYGFPHAGTFPVDSQGKIRRNVLNVWLHLHMANEPSYIDSFNCTMVQLEDDDDEDDRDDYSITSEEDEICTVATDVAVVLDPPPAATVAKYTYAASASGGRINNDVLHQISIASSSSSSQNTPATITEQQQQKGGGGQHRPDHDVFFGRGRGIQDHPGNIRCREYLQEYHHAYDTAPRNQRGKVTKALTNALRQQGTRFYERNQNREWVEAEPKVIEKKIGQLLREFRKKKNQNQG
ncbi:unnamed protein product [Cylindrotheca closterium]|uniref:DUF6824 domain-containing protein n=1 Tax=Cylindrotheca closterium TaxID=2856 RepID=A0AAD2CC45_9STRA|nr:unnamed protein product [Cylindrotheca closterium]